MGQQLFCCCKKDNYYQVEKDKFKNWYNNYSTDDENNNSTLAKPIKSNNQTFNIHFNNELVKCNVLDSFNCFNLVNDEKINLLKLNNIFIPEEIVLLIFSYLTIEEIISLSSINSIFNNYWTNHSQIWKDILLLKNLNCVNKFTICCCNDINNFKQFYKKIYIPNKKLNYCFTQNTSQDCNYTYKFVMHGDQNIGKSTFLEKFINNNYSFNENNYSQTIGVEVKAIKLLFTKNKKIGIYINFWDLGGDERFKTILEAYYRGSNGLIICFDLTNESTLGKVEENIKNFIMYNDLNKGLVDLNSKLLKNRQLVISVVGLKCDKYNEMNRNKSLDNKIKLLLKKLIPNEVKYEDLFIQYFEVDSKKNINVNAPIYFIASKLIDNNVNFYPPVCVSVK